jgi:hypothetical protein
MPQPDWDTLAPESSNAKKGAPPDIVVSLCPYIEHRATSFYGPVRKGQVQEMLSRGVEDWATRLGEDAIAKVRAGSNLVELRDYHGNALHYRAVGPLETTCRYVYPDKGPAPKDRDIKIAFAFGLAANHNEELGPGRLIDLQTRAREFMTRLEKACRAPGEYRDNWRVGDTAIMVIKEMTGELR